ncbi:iron/manganese transporter [Terrimonas sp.]|uniref:Nramp family divalent metal transporter n=1 Tax=Terrimonas sp. TaxID=1914338 RepID=UPI000D51110F|nr:Nramp family divalent metal transporter [Terrimonas sp.]PVD53316.1 iron/manganese transporter [Terrimonas sp.]
MNSNIHSDASLSEVHGSIDTTATQNKPWWKRMLAFIGPAYLVGVGYMDPGNWATDLAGGSKFGYTLIWVLLMSNLMALLLQSLSARLGIVRGRDLAQANRETYPKRVNFILYILAEIAIAATDLAEVLGMAIGLHLLTGIPLIWGVCITVLDTFLLLFLQRMGMRVMEAFIITLVGIISISFLIEIVLAKPNLAEVATGFVPRIPNSEALYIAIGIIGATVMPHNLYLHSSLVQTRKIKRDEKSIKYALKMSVIDSTIALNLAFLVNAAILVLAAATFFKSGRTEVAQLEEAHQLLSPLLGTNLASTLFAIALIAAGQSSTVTGTLAGQIVMEGYLRLRINPLLRRLITRLIAIVPALIVISIYGDKELDALLILSQVILSLQLGFAVIPLIHFVSDKKTMGVFAIKPVTKVFAWIIAVLLVYLNIRMVGEEAVALFTGSGNWFWKVFIIAAVIFFVGLLLYVSLHPFFTKYQKRSPATVHPEATGSLELSIPTFEKIGIALDFSDNDKKLISYAIAQGNAHATYVLMHVVESVSAKMLKHESDDFETKEDKKRLEHYKNMLAEAGYKAETQIGFDKRSDEIVRMAKETNCEMLVMGAHGHKGVEDFIHGETVDAVRHRIKIPVLIVNV